MRALFLLLVLSIPAVIAMVAAPNISAAAQTCVPAVSTSVTTIESTSGGAVALMVTVRADTSRDASNVLSQVRFTDRKNSIVDVPSLGQRNPTVVMLTPPVATWTFNLRQGASAGTFQTTFVATDRCGEVSKLVGMGAGGASSAQPTATATAVPATPTPVPTATRTPTSVPTASPSPTATLVAAPNTGKQFGVSLAGAEFGPSKLPGRPNYDYVYPTDHASYQYYAGKGQTLIRIPFLWERMQPTLLGPLSEVDLAGLKATLDSAETSGQRVIVDLHNYGRYRDQPLVRADAARLADVWVRLARELRSHPALFGYEIMNEPHDMPDGSAGWAEICQTVTNAIRTEDTEAWILIPGYSWQSAHTWPGNNAALNVQDPANHLLYAAHAYFDSDNSGTYKNGYDATSPNIGPDRLRPFSDWLAQRNARGILTEYGVPDNDARWIEVLSRFMAALDGDARIVGGTYWAGGPWWGNYPLAVEPRSGQDRPQIGVLAAHPSRN